MSGIPYNFITAFPSVITRRTGFCTSNFCYLKIDQMMIPSLFNKRNLAIDLGNNNTLLSDGNQLLLSEPSYIVFDANTNKVKAVGDQAFDIFGKNHDNLKPMQPLKWGVIADYNSAVAMIGGMVSKVSKKSFFSG